jgi:hypothetical protein
MARKRPVTRMIAEGFREIGLLWLTFGLLDGVLRERPVSWTWYVEVVILGVGVFALGVAVDPERKE